jgi:hypothetical protein
LETPFNPQLPAPNLAPKTEQHRNRTVHFIGSIVKPRSGWPKKSFEPPISKFRTMNTKGRNNNSPETRVDSYGRSTLVDFAALHTAFCRHQGTDRGTKIAVAEPAATAPAGAKTELRNRDTNQPVGGYFCGGDLSPASTDSKALNRLRSTQLRKFG